LSGRGGRYNDDIRLESQAFAREGRKPLAPAVRGQVVDSDGLPIHVTQVAQALEERHESVRLRRTRIERKEAEPRGFLRLLRIDGERQSENYEREENREMAQ
jgi:hypothetical protein